MGMSVQEFWYSDPDLVRAYRKAKEIKDKERNDFLWLQGRYVYDAICKSAPLLNDLKPTEPIPYDEVPYPMSLQEAEEREAELAKKKMEEQISRLNKIMAKEREDAENG